jgi:hypothetical protein
MSKPLIVPFSSDLVVSGNYTLRFTALEPTTGAVVSGVNIAGAAVTGINRSTSASTVDDLTPLPLLVPSSA